MLDDRFASPEGKDSSVVGRLYPVIIPCLPRAPDDNVVLIPPCILSSTFTSDDAHRNRYGRS